MTCSLCHQHIDLWDLDVSLGFPVHETCGDAYRAEADAVLAEAEALVLAESDPRRHRNHLRPPTAA